MYTKIFRYHVSEKNYATWLNLSRASNALYKKYPEVSFQQTPTRKMGGDMTIEEIVIYPSKEVCEEIEADLQQHADTASMTELFHEIVPGEVQIEERGE